MNVVTISKREYETLKKDATAWRRVLSANRGSGTRIPNKETLKAIRGLRAGKGKIHTGSTKQLFDRLVHGKSTAKKLKKLPAGLRQALREVEQGKLRGPFNSVEEFMADLKR